MFAFGDGDTVVDHEFFDVTEVEFVIVLNKGDSLDVVVVYVDTQVGECCFDTTDSVCFACRISCVNKS